MIGILKLIIFYIFEILFENKNAGSETASSVFDRLITYTDPGHAYMWSKDDDPNSWAW